MNSDDVIFFNTIVIAAIVLRLFPTRPAAHYARDVLVTLRDPKVGWGTSHNKLARASFQNIPVFFNDVTLVRLTLNIAVGSSSS